MFLISPGTLYAGHGSIKISVTPAPVLSVYAKFSEPSGNGILDAGEKGKIVISAKNKGFVAAKNVRASVRANKNVKGLNFDRTVNFGTMEKGESTTRELTLRSAGNLDSETVTVSITITDARKTASDSASITFKTRESSKPVVTTTAHPKLVIADSGIADQSCNLKIESGESVDVTVRVQNIGKGPAEGVKVLVNLGNHVKLGEKSKKEFDIGSLKAGSYKDILFNFSTDKSLHSGDKIPIEIKVTERRAQFTVTEDLGFTVDGRAKSVRFLKSR